MSRGRLVWPMMADLRQLDTMLTAEDPDDAGPIESGYDADFREAAIVPAETSQGPGRIHRVEKTPLYLPCQVEVPRFGDQTAVASGFVTEGELLLVFHFADLERQGLLDATTNEAGVRIGDRLAAIYRPGGELAQSFERAPLFAVEVQPSSFGLSARVRNLLLVRFKTRENAPAA